MPSFEGVGTLSLSRCDLPTWRLASFTGDASYALYLAHLAPVTFLRVIWTKMGLPAASIAASFAFHVIAIVASIVVAYAVYLWVDRPIQRYLGGVSARLDSRRPA